MRKSRFGVGAGCPDTDARPLSRQKKNPGSEEPGHPLRFDAEPARRSASCRLFLRVILRRLGDQIANRVNELLQRGANALKMSAIRARGRSLYQLEDDTGIDRSRLSRFLRGERSITLDAAGRICEVLGISLSVPPSLANEAAARPPKRQDRKR